jgi:hypothetical protein
MNNVQYEFHDETLRAKFGREYSKTDGHESRHSITVLRSAVYYLDESLFPQYRHNVLQIGSSYSQFSRNAANLRRIWIPSTIETIQDKAFRGCTLRDVMFESGSRLTRIEQEAFTGTHLKIIRIPSSVEYIGMGCFWDCKYLCEVVFESGSKLRRIKGSAFAYTALKIIQIPSSVELIGPECFCQCKSLSEVRFESGCSLKEISDRAFDGTNLNIIDVPDKCEMMSGISLIGVKKVYISEENPFFIQDASFIKSFDKKVMIRYQGHDEHIVIGEEIERISADCFYECKTVSEVTFESGTQLERIKKYTFAETGLKKVRIPSSVEYIGQHCFYQCKYLGKVTFEPGSKLGRIGESAFSGTGLKKIQIPASVETIENSCFCGCDDLSEVEFGSGSKLRYIGECVFTWCGLKTIRIPSNVETIGESCFERCHAFHTITFEGTVKVIEGSAFHACPLKYVRLVHGEKLGHGFPFGDCDIEYVKRH